MTGNDGTRNEDLNWNLLVIGFIIEKLWWGIRLVKREIFLDDITRWAIPIQMLFTSTLVGTRL